MRESGNRPTLNKPASTVHKVLRNFLNCYSYEIAMCRSCFLLIWLQERLLLRISCSDRSEQRMAVENCVHRQSSFPSDRICQNRELLNMGNRQFTRNTICITSSCIGHCVVRACDIIYHRDNFFQGDGCFSSRDLYNHWSTL